MIYLSWSVIHLAVVLVLLALAYVGVRKADYHFLGEFEQELSKALKTTNLVFSLLFVSVLFMAIDVGDKDAVKYRTSFDAPVEQKQIDKVESQRPTLVDVQEAFNKAVGR